MSEKSPNTTIFTEGIIQFFRKTAEEWATDNTKIAKGEPALLLDEDGNTIEIRYGNGEDRFVDLPSLKSLADLKYNPKSPNAQSGIALADAFAPIIRPTLVGNVITAHDVSPIEHELKITANLFKVDKVKEQDNDKGKVVVNADGTLTVSNETQNYLILGKLTILCPFLKGGDTITFSYQCDNLNCGLGLKHNSNSTFGDEIGSYAEANTLKTLTLPEDIRDVYMYFSCDSYPHTISNIALFKGVVDDITKLKVNRYGKNIFNIANAPVHHTIENASVYDYEKTDSGVKVTCVTDLGGSPKIGFILGKTEDLRGKEITVSYDYSAELANGVDKVTNTVYVYAYKEGANKTMYIANEPKETVKGVAGTKTTFSIGDNITLPYIAIHFHLASGSTAKAGDVIEFSNIQVEIGNKATEYEPYVEPQTVNANADGTVTGLTSLSPSMTIMSNDADITLECEYNADTKLYIDNKIAELVSGAAALVSTEV